MPATNTKLEGVFAAAVTPRRRASQEIDLGAMWDLIDFLGAKKVDGIVLFGSTGEFVHFGIEERSRIIGLAVKRSRVPVMVNVSHSTLDGAVTLAESAMYAGAAGLLLMPPYFFRYTQADVLAFYRKFAQDIHLRVPVLLYQIPIFTNEITVQTAGELLLDGPYAGVKDSGGDPEWFGAVNALRSQKPFTLLVGSDPHFSEFRSAGADGAISGIACCLPELIVGLRKAVDAGDTAKVGRLNAYVNEFADWIGNFPVPVGIKEAVQERGIKCSPCAVPMLAGDEQKLADFKNWFRNWHPAVIKESL